MTVVEVSSHTSKPLWYSYSIKDLKKSICYSLIVKILKLVTLLWSGLWLPCLVFDCVPMVLVAKIICNMQYAVLIIGSTLDICRGWLGHGSPPSSRSTPIWWLSTPTLKFYTSPPQTLLPSNSKSTLNIMIFSRPFSILIRSELS